MNRRHFLKTLFGAGAALAAGPSLLSLVPKAPPTPAVFTFESFECVDLLATEEVIARYIRPAAQAMADDIDRRCMEMVYRDIPLMERAA